MDGLGGRLRRRQTGGCDGALARAGKPLEGRRQTRIWLALPTPDGLPALARYVDPPTAKRPGQGSRQPDCRPPVILLRGFLTLPHNIDRPMPVMKLSLAHQTMFAELVQRCFDATFDEQFPERGRFYKTTVKGRAYWYYETPRAGGAREQRRYVGPVDDPAVSERVERFQSIKADYRERRSLVRSLVAAGLPRPIGIVGDVVEALAKAGLFRLRGVLIGTTAFQCYGGYLGMRLPAQSVTTADVDFAQYRSISAAVEDSLPPMLDTLRAVDPSFVAVSGLDATAPPARYRNDRHLEVEFLTPNRGSDDHQSRPAAMPSLGGAGAQPLRFLDFLLRDPVRSVILHGGGGLVTIPAPERFAVHKLIVAARRRDDDNGRLKARKDLVQSELILAALQQERRLDEVGEVYLEAGDRGPKWRETLSRGRDRLQPSARAMLDESIVRACRHADRPTPEP